MIRKFQKFLASLLWRKGKDDIIDQEVSQILDDLESFNESNSDKREKSSEDFSIKKGW